MKIERKETDKTTRQKLNGCQCNYANNYYGDQACIKAKRTK